MCDFPSWIEAPDRTALFLTDKDIKSLPQTFTNENLPGHSAIRSVYPKAKGKEKEGFPCHPDVAKAIIAGQMRKMMKAGGYKEVYVNANGQYHRVDGPAIEWANGDKCWYKNGQHHRDDGPAIECANGDKHWYKNGLYHRDDGPAIEYANGDKHWYKNGLLSNMPMAINNDARFSRDKVNEKVKVII